MFGQVTNPKNEGLPDLSWREKWTLIPLFVLAVWIGLYPKPFFEIIDKPIERLVETQVNPVLRAFDVPVTLPPEEGGTAVAEALEDPAHE